MPANAQSIILHQYDISPFSEKVRVIIGIKGLEWYACDQPVIMPKPELTTLTGGYRKIPVMQIGADVFCDTQIIIRELERRFPSPSIHVGSDKGLGWGLSVWTDRSIFQAAVPIIFGGISAEGGNEALVSEAFMKDREALTGRPFNVDEMKAAAPLMADQMRAQFDWAEHQLGLNQNYLMGEAPGLVDASLYYNLAFMRWVYPKGLTFLKTMPGVEAWEHRVKALGHGTRHDISRNETLDIAKAATSSEKPHTDPAEPNGLEAGMRVTIMADDYGRDPISGELVSSSAQHIAIKRSDERIGDVVLHFPRMGFFVVKS
jgi:glutathione S-transferase